MCTEHICYSAGGVFQIARDVTSVLPVKKLLLISSSLTVRAHQRPHVPMRFFMYFTNARLETKIC